VRLFALLLMLCIAGGSALAGESGPTPDAATQAEILALRERAWRTWFANDQAGFREIVPDELVAIGWEGGPWGDRDEALRQMTAFAAGGRTLVSLEFPRNVFQHYGDAVILYTRFHLVLEAADGTRSDARGRGTEVFVRRHGRWIHTGWHLDTVADD